MSLASRKKKYKIKVTKESVHEDCAEVVDIFGQGCNYATSKGVKGFHVEFLVEVRKNSKSCKVFCCIFQSCDRNDNMYAYNGVEMTSAIQFGLDCDETSLLTEYVNDDERYCDKLISRAENLCRKFLKDNMQGED